jgi:hypothetical protein
LADRYLMGERGMSFKTLIDVQLITKENVGKYNTHINRD